MPMTAPVDDLAESVFAAVKSFCEQECARLIEAAMAPMLARIEGIQEAKDGAPGERGEAGPAGADGKDGSTGIDGKDGAPGQDGTNGQDGKDGASGKDGTNGQDGAAGEKGDDGLPGFPGEDGRDGRDGKDGAPGRDAAHLDILEFIDGTRSYPRGTFAKHLGGLVRAVRSTDELSDDVEASGWQIVLDPIVKFDPVQSETDPRLFELRSVSAFGKTSTKMARIPVMVYRGVFAEGNDYEPGDATTWGGSMWHCDEPTTDKPGEGSKAWRLAVKRGRDGKDGVQGAKGEPGLTQKAYS